MFKNNKTEETLADLIKNARQEKELSARKLASLLKISHTELNNIESGFRVKPSIIILKGIEQYLGIPFSKTAELAGYSKETIKYGEDEIIVSYEMYDKKIKKIEEELKYVEFIVDQKRHIAMDVKECFEIIHNYLKNQKNTSKDILDKADLIEKYLSEIEKKYKRISKEK